MTWGYRPTPQCRGKEKSNGQGAVVCLQECCLMRDHTDDGATMDLIGLLVIVFAGSLLGNLVYHWIKGVRNEH